MANHPASEGRSILERIAQDPRAAADELRAARTRDPHNATVLRLLARALRALGQIEEAEHTEVAAIRASAQDPELLQAAAALVEQDLPTAEQMLRARLNRMPNDVAAIRMLAELAARLGRYQDSENLLRRAVELAPSFTAARANLAGILYKQSRYEEAAAILEEVLRRDPHHAGGRNLLAATRGRIGDYDEALAMYQELVAIFPEHAKLWMSYGHILKTVGRQDDSVAAYHRALALEECLGEVWWSLANLKTVQFSPEDIAAMEAALGTTDDHENIFHLHFALGKAYGDQGLYSKSFAHYDQGNARRRKELGYRPAATTEQVARVISVFDQDFADHLKDAGCPTPDPIFILGMPRAGSTLLEQILASHSAVEGTMELPDIPAMAMREARALGKDARDWIGALQAMPHARLTELGAEFLERTRIQRKTPKPFFIDKLPNNWAYAGFIMAILPNAKIIDARRDPLDCCFSNFRQHFAKGQAFSYGLEDMGLYYRDYVHAMDHYERVMPGAIHRVIHEELLDDPRRIVADLLAYLGLPFEEACLDFHRNTRAVRTASSEQVRRPINRDGVGQWKAYEEWLGPLVAALGDLPTTYTRR